MEVIVKKTAQHSAGSKYLERAAEGAIPAPVYFAPKGNKVEASIDGEAIGFVVEGISTDAIPAQYNAKVVGLGDKPSTFKVEVEILKEAIKAGPVADVSAFADEIAEAEKRSGLTDVAERVAVMIDNNVNPAIISAALESFYRVNFSNSHTPSALYKNTREADEISILSQALMAAVNRNALIFSGEKSTGKNVCAETVAYVLGLPYYRINFERDMLLEDVYGTKTTDNSAADRLDVKKALAKVRCETTPELATAEDFQLAAEFEVDKAKSACIRLVQTTSDIIRWAKEGGVMMYDEANMANANILQVVMNSTADAEKTLIVPGVGSIKLHENCVLLAGMNPGYAGTNELNVATKSRCGFINFEFPKSITAQLKANFKEGEVPEQYYNACEKLYGVLKGVVEAKTISSECLNIRGFVNALKNVARFPGVTKLRDELNIYVVAGCGEEERDVIETYLYTSVNI